MDPSSYYHPTCPDPDHTRVFDHFINFWGIKDSRIALLSVSPSPPARREPFYQGTRTPLTPQVAMRLGLPLGELIKAVEEEEDTLRREWERLAGAESAFSDEVLFMDQYLPKRLEEEDGSCGDGNGQSASGIVYLSARGYKLATHHHVINHFQGSVLSSIFDRERWPGQPEEVDQDGHYYMEEASPYCLGKLMDLLRLRVKYGITDATVEIMEGKKAEFQVGGVVT